MLQKKLELVIEEYASAEELMPNDYELLLKAQEATQLSWAPYSLFRVGAAARLDNDILVSGANQENASFPAGICAERVLLSTIASQFPGIGISAIAVSYDNEHGASDHPISPCGICRQSLVEFETRFKQPIRLILGGLKGKIILVPSARTLLPLAFTSGELI